LFLISRRLFRKLGMFRNIRSSTANDFIVTLIERFLNVEKYALTKLSRSKVA